MRVARRDFLASAMATVAVPAVMRLARADAPIALKLHHAMSSVSAGHDKFLVPWARKVETEAGGRIRIDLFPSMQLGGSPARLFDQARDGTVDIAWTMPSLTPGRFPKIEMFELPFVPARRALVSSRALDDFATVNLKDEFRDVHPLGFSCSDRGVVHANSPIRTIEDIKDLKLHVQTRFAGETVRLLGGHPVPMSDAQLPMAITARVIDGCIDPWHMVPPLRLNDLLKTHTEFSDTSLSSTTFVLVMNKDAYDRLPRDLKTVIDNNSGQYAAGLAGTMWDLGAAAAADMVGERGDTIVTLLPEAVAHWRKATDPVTGIWLKEMKEQKVDGNKLLASARALLAKYASLPEPQSTQSPSPQQETVTEPPRRPEAQADTAMSPKPAASAVPTSPAPKPAPAPTAQSTPSPTLSKPSPPPTAQSAPAPQPVPAPHMATHAPPSAAPPAPPASPAPMVKPAVTTAPPATAAPPQPPPALAATPPLPPAPAPPPAPVPVPKPVPAVAPPPKGLDIPL
jgi:TRAP-type C4-dicarboxylate transport system substrate-binding protein